MMALTCCGWQVTGLIFTTETRSTQRIMDIEKLLSYIFSHRYTRIHTDKTTNITKCLSIPMYICVHLWLKTISATEYEPQRTRRPRRKKTETLLKTPSCSSCTSWCIPFPGFDINHREHEAHEELKTQPPENPLRALRVLRGVFFSQCLYPPQRTRSTPRINKPNPRKITLRVLRGVPFFSVFDLI